MAERAIPGAGLNLDLNALRAFVAVVDSGGVNAAAQSLHLTQSAVTKRLQALESQAGQTLMDRVGRHLQLTEAGVLLLSHARQLLAGADEAARAMARFGDDDAALAGRLDLATSHHIGLHRLPPVLRGFTTAHPGVDLHIDFVDSEDGCRAVERGDCELAIVTLPADASRWPKLTLTRLWDDPMVFVAAPNHPLADRHSVQLDDLAATPAILPDARTFTHRLIGQAFAAAGLQPQVRMHTNYLETIRMLVAIGLGWSALPAPLLGDDLVALPVDASIHRQLGVVRHADRSLSRAAAALMQALTAQAPPTAGVAP